MKRAALALSIIILVGCRKEAAQENVVESPPLLEIPRQFWGEYNSDLGACGAASNDSRLRISWDELQFYASIGKLREIIRQSDRSVIVVANHSGEGERWTSTYQLELSEDGKELTVRTSQDAESDSTEMTRHRCPT